MLYNRYRVTHLYVHSFVVILRKYLLSFYHPQVQITLEETDTIWHLDIPGVTVSSSDDNAEDIKERNQQYEAVRKYLLEILLCIYLL